MINNSFCNFLKLLVVIILSSGICGAILSYPVVLVSQNQSNLGLWLYIIINSGFITGVTISSMYESKKSSLMFLILSMIFISGFIIPYLLKLNNWPLVITFGILTGFSSGGIIYLMVQSALKLSYVDDKTNNRIIKNDMYKTGVCIGLLYSCYSLTSYYLVTPLQLWTFSAPLINVMKKMGIISAAILVFSFLLIFINNKSRKTNAKKETVTIELREDNILYFILISILALTTILEVNFLDSIKKFSQSNDYISLDSIKIVTTYSLTLSFSYLLGSILTRFMNKIKLLLISSLFLLISVVLIYFTPASKLIYIGFVGAFSLSFIFIVSFIYIITTIYLDLNKLGYLIIIYPLFSTLSGYIASFYDKFKHFNIIFSILIIILICILSKRNDLRFKKIK